MDNGQMQVDSGPPQQPQMDNGQLQRQLLQLAEQVRQLTHTNNNLNQRLVAAEGNNAQLRREVNEGTPTSSEVTQPPTMGNNGNNGSTRPRHKLDHIGKFSGERKDWESWELNARLKIQIDHEAIGMDADQFGYLYSRFEPKAQNLVSTWVKDVLNDQSHEATAKSFLKHAKTVFGDPNAQRNAIVALNVIKQKKDEFFSEYLSRFETTLYKAGGLSWPDAIKVNHLYTSLNDELSDALVGTPGLHTDDYASFKNDLFVIDAQLQARRTRHRRGQNTGPAPRPTMKTTSTNAHADVMDWEPTKTNTAQWVSETELQRRRENGLCLRCGRSGHRIARCNMKPARRPLQAAPADVHSESDVAEKE